MSVAGQVTTRSVRWRGDAGWNQTYRLQVGLDWCGGALQARADAVGPRLVWGNTSTGRAPSKHRLHMGGRRSTGGAEVNRGGGGQQGGRPPPSTEGGRPPQ